MSAARPYYFLSQSQLTHFETWLQSLLAMLARRWWLDSPLIKITATACTADNMFAKRNVRHIYQRDDSYLAICGGDKSWLAAVSGWLGCEVDQSSSLTKELEDTYCKELIGSMSHIWCPSLGVSHADAKEIISNYSRPGNGGIAVDIMINNFSLTLLTTAYAFPEIFVAKDKSTNVSLIDVTKALDVSTVALKAHLSAVQVPLLGVSALRVGDFIDLRHDLSGEILLSGISADISLKAELGKCGNNKAAQITSVNRNE